MPATRHCAYIEMHRTYHNYMLEVAQEAIFIKIQKFQQHQQNQWGNTNTLQHKKECNVVGSGGRSGGIVSQHQIRVTN